MKKNLETFSFISLFSLIPSALLWLPFFFRLETFWGIKLPKEGMATIVANYDGPLFLVVAKTLYEASLINQFPFDLSAIYYAAHYPLYPIFISFLGPLVTYPYAMLMVTLLTSIGALYYFYKLALDFVGEKNALWLTFIFAIFPARWLIVRSVGSAEPLFIGTLLASIYHFRKGQFLQAGIWGALAQLTKSPGILLFLGYAIFILIQTFRKAALKGFSKSISFKPFFSYLPILLIPFSLLSLFIFYGYRYNDFFAYFNSGDNHHIFFPPFQVFNPNQPWVGTFWLEEIIFIYLFGMLGFSFLMKKKEYAIACFYAVFLSTLFFVAHRDILRYALPIVPLFLLAFSDYLVKKEFRYILAILAIPIYLYSLVYISNNVMPITNWTPFI